DRLVSFDLCGNELNRKEIIDGKEDRVFEIMRYTISFVLNGYGEEISNRKGSYIPDELPIPNDETMVFAGWYLDDEFTTPVEAGAIIFGDVTLYAKWIENPWI
ncbi:MAG: InlB B-repeat-containing protein, partial [Anaeroplasmataceae bacterium]|nr:InlB B-repeat-containing protein [Anaeroplasmataceae bacterium]